MAHKGGIVVCRSCGSENRSTFGAEISLVRTGRNILGSNPVYILEKAMVCLECGFLELTIPKPALEALKGTSSQPSDSA